MGSLIDTNTQDQSGSWIIAMKRYSTLPRSPASPSDAASFT